MYIRLPCILRWLYKIPSSLLFLPWILFSSVTLFSYVFIILAAIWVHLDQNNCLSNQWILFPRCQYTFKLNTIYIFITTISLYTFNIQLFTQFYTFISCLFEFQRIWTVQVLCFIKYIITPYDHINLIFVYLPLFLNSQSISSFSLMNFRSLIYQIFSQMNRKRSLFGHWSVCIWKSVQIP